MNTYKKFTDKKAKEIDDFMKQYCFVAFSKEQYLDGLKKFNLPIHVQTNDKIKYVGAGVYVLADHEDDLIALIDRLNAELAALVEKNENDFIYQMFLYELNNHEFSYTGDPEETLDALEYTLEDLQDNPKLKEGFLKAANKIIPGFKIPFDGVMPANAKN